MSKQAERQPSREEVDAVRALAHAGNATAQTQMGIASEKGISVPKDDSEAARWYRLAADQGDAAAQYFLGDMHLRGRGVPQDSAEAVRLFRISAHQGDAFAQYALGVMYANGHGVPQDEAEAVGWYRLAAEQGHIDAQSKLGVMYLEGRGVQQDDRQAAKWFGKAADQGHSDAKYNLIIVNGFDHRDYQDYFEVCATRDWARELRKSHHSIPDYKIKKNDDDPPDVLADMDGKRIGVEVTRLVNEQTQKCNRKYRSRPEKQKVALWPREEFQEHLVKAVRKKDSNMKNRHGKMGRVPGLHKQFLLLVTDELHLGEGVLADYLSAENKVTVPRPDSFDAVYVMGRVEFGEETNPVEVHYPVFEVSLS